MAAYQVEIDRSARKALLRLPRQAQHAIRDRIEALSSDPRGPGTVKMRDNGDEYRVRVGDCRIRYTIRDDVLVVTAVEIAHRKDIYRPF